ncbi:MAG: hypothetical protein V4568_01050 [Pseudomonadota bacterium]
MAGSDTEDELKQDQTVLYSQVETRLIAASGDKAEEVKEFLTAHGIGNIKTAGQIWVPGEKIGEAGISHSQLHELYQKFKLEKEQSKNVGFTPKEVAIEAPALNDLQQEVLSRGFPTWPPASFTRLGDSADATQRKKDITDLLVDEIGEKQTLGGELNGESIQKKVHAYYERLTEIYVDRSQHIGPNEPMVIAEESVKDLQLHWENIVSEAKDKLAIGGISVAEKNIEIGVTADRGLEHELTSVVDKSAEEIEGRQKKARGDEGIEQKKDTLEELEEQKKLKVEEERTHEVLHEQEKHHQEEVHAHHKEGNQEGNEGLDGDDSDAETIQTELSSDESVVSTALTEDSEQNVSLTHPETPSLEEGTEKAKTLTLAKTVEQWRAKVAFLASEPEEVKSIPVQELSAAPVFSTVDRDSDETQNTLDEPQLDQDGEEEALPIPVKAQKKVSWADDKPGGKLTEHHVFSDEENLAEEIGLPKELHLDDIEDAPTPLPEDAVAQTDASLQDDKKIEAEPEDIGSRIGRLMTEGFDDEGELEEEQQDKPLQEDQDKKSTDIPDEDEELDLESFFRMAESNGPEKTPESPNSQEEEARKRKQAKQNTKENEETVSVRIGDQQDQNQTVNNQMASNGYPAWFNKRYGERDTKGEFYKNTDPQPDKPSIIDGPDNGQLQLVETSDQTIKDAVLLAKARGGSKEIIIEGGGLTDDIAFKFLKEVTLQGIKAKINPPPVITPERQAELDKVLADKQAMDARPILEYHIDGADKRDVNDILQEANDDLGYLRATEQSSKQLDESIKNIEERVRDKCGPRELVSAQSTQTFPMQSPLTDQPLPESAMQLPTPPLSTELKPQVLPTDKIPSLELPLAASKMGLNSPPLSPTLERQDSLLSSSVPEPSKNDFPPLANRNLPPLDLHLPQVVITDEGFYTVKGGVPAALTEALKVRNENLEKMKKTNKDYENTELASMPEKLILTKTLTEDFKHLKLTGIKEVVTAGEGDEISGEVAYKNPANGDAYVIRDRNPANIRQSHARVMRVPKELQDIMNVDLQRGDITRGTGLLAGVPRGQEQAYAVEKSKKQAKVNEIGGNAR